MRPGLHITAKEAVSPEQCDSTLVHFNQIYRCLKHFFTWHLQHPTAAAARNSAQHFVYRQRE